MKKLLCAVLLFSLQFTTTACAGSQVRQSSDWQTKNNTLSSVQSNAGTEERKQPDVKANTEMQEDIPQTEPVQENRGQEAAELKMKIQVEDVTFTATLADNSSVDALKELMADGPLTLNMNDYAGMEKGADLGVALPQNNEQMNVQAGDIILYQGRTFVIYYDTNSWSLTPIGKIDNVSAKERREALGAGDVTVILSLESESA